MARPSGIVAFTFTDIEGSTRLWADDPDGMAASLRVHDVLVRDVVDGHGGHVFATGGDGFAAAFARASDAVAAATAIQAALAATHWPGPALAVRIGLHVGEADERDGDYFGTAVNTAARVMAAGHGGQVLATEAAAAAAGVEGIELGRHRLAGLPDPVPLRQLGPGSFPPLRGVTASVVALPSPRTELVGRDEAVADLVGLVRARRLVSLVGAGGVGKTRLAVEVARIISGEFPDGVWFVDLTPVATDEGVVGALFDALGLIADAGHASVGQVAAFLAPRRALVVVDNCEHVVDGAARCVDDLLAAAADLTVLATTRELLGVDGEHAWRVPSLTTGPSSASSALFTQRAGEAGATEHLDHRVVDEICERLDGIPLAIELAAARSAALPLAELRDRLDDRFRLLDGGRRRRRQQTLDATVRWSYDLFDEEEQRFLQVLGVFVGSFRAADAAAVVGLDDFAAFDLLDSLVARSMVAPVGDRYRLLETIRLFALERLVEAGRAEAVRDAFLDHFASDPVIVDWAVGASLAGEARMHDDYDNFRAAGWWAVQRGRPSDAARIAAALADAMTARGELELGREWLAHTEGLDDEQRTKCLTLAAHLCWTAADADGLRRHVGAALALAADRYYDIVPFAYVLQASVAGVIDGDRRLADRLLEQAAALAPRTSAGPVSEAVVDVYLAAHRGSMGDFEGALRALDAAIALAPHHLTRPVAEAARILTLVTLGRLADARADAPGISPMSPSSPYRHLREIAVILADFDAEAPAVTGLRLAEAAPESIARQPSATGDWLMGFGYFAWLRGDVERALHLADNCLALRIGAGTLVAAIEQWGPDFHADVGRYWADEAPVVRMIRSAPTTGPLLEEECRRWSGAGEDNLSRDSWRDDQSASSRR